MQTAFGEQTDTDGWADLGRFLPGQRTVHVVDRGFETQSLEIVVRLEPFEKVVTLVRTDGSLSGTVLDPDGDPVRGGQVGFASEGATFAAALQAIDWPIREDGSFKIEHLPAAPGHVWVMADGFAAQRVQVPFAPAARTEGFVARLEARGTVRGRLVTREGEPVPSLAVHLRQDIALGNDAHSVALVARTVSGADGAFEFRGVADEDYRVSARDAEWIMVESLLKVSAGDLDVVARMKPAREGSGIRLTLSVPPADDGTPVPGPISVEYRAEERPWAMTPGPKLDGDLWQFGFHSKPGRYDLTVHCVGFLPCEIRGVTIEDRPDPPPIVARFRRGGVVRLRALDESGAPLRGISVSAGNLLLRTDENGECEVSGLEPKEQELRLELVGEQYVFGVAKVRPPGRADVTIRKHGYVRVILTDRVYGDLKEKLVWRLLDEQDRVVDESVFDLSEIGKWYARDRKIEGWLKAAAKGSYRVSVEMDGERMEAPVEIVPGERAVLGIPPR
jgi:protocatechuate 3,4-dioxygenase beta subunit